MNAHLTAAAGSADLVRSMTVRAASLAFVFIPISVVALSDVPAAQRGNATGLFNLTRELGGSIGTAWMGLLVDRGTKIHGSYLAEHVSVYEPVAREQYLALQATFGQPLVPETLLALRVRTQALVLAFQDGFYSATLVFLFSLALVALLRRPKPGAAPAGAH
jgi:MFS transporter, DHA2 family, multidrug resistance protein